MHQWYVIGLFECKRTPPGWDHGFVATWAVIAGPFDNIEWAQARAKNVTPHHELRIEEAHWRCVFSCVVKKADLRSYGLGYRGNQHIQLALPMEEE